MDDERSCDGSAFQTALTDVQRHFNNFVTVERSVQPFTLLSNALLSELR